MVFWSDRFRREDEEDIWEELKQKLMNPPSEQEIALKKQQEQAQIEALTDKMFPDIVQPKKEPYLTQEELFPQKRTSDELAGMAVQLKPLDGFGQNLHTGLNANTFPDLGKLSDYKNEGIAPIYDNGDRTKIYFRDPNKKNVLDEINEPWVKKKPKNEMEEPLGGYVKMPEGVENTTSEGFEGLEESKEAPSEHQGEQYLNYEDLLPDETDEERGAREARELEAFSKAWDKANGVEENVSKNPSQETLKATIIKDNILTPYNDEIEKNPDLTEEEKFAKKLEIYNIHQDAKIRKKEIEREHVINQAKNIGKEVLPFFIPEILPAKLVAKISNSVTPLVEKTMPNIGNIYKKELSKETAKNILTSPIVSTQEAIEENKNIPQTVLKNLPTDLTQNYLLSGGKITKNKLRMFDSLKKKVPNWNTRQQRKQNELQEYFYRDYVNKKFSYEDFLKELRRRRRRR